MYNFVLDEINIKHGVSQSNCPSILTHLFLKTSASPVGRYLCFETTLDTNLCSVFVLVENSDFSQLRSRLFY